MSSENDKPKPINTQLAYDQENTENTQHKDSSEIINEDPSQRITYSQDLTPHETEQDEEFNETSKHTNLNTAIMAERRLDEFEYVKNAEELGRGAYGNVYLVTDKKTKKKYAMKVIAKKYLFSKASARQIKREVKIQSKLYHHHVCNLEYYFEDKKNIYLILEYAENGSQFFTMRKKGRLTEEEAFPYFIQTCLGLDYLHDRNVIHRDLKPENLLLNGNNEIKLCDFGWSVKWENKMRNTFCGTLDYMAPEMIAGKSYGFPVDTWSLGVLLYEMLQGETPFRSRNHSELIQLMKSGLLKRPPIPFQHNISLEAKHLLLNLQCYNPNERIEIQNIWSHPWVLKNKTYNFLKAPSEKSQKLYSKNPSTKCGDDMTDDGVNSNKNTIKTIFSQTTCKSQASNVESPTRLGKTFLPVKSPKAKTPIVKLNQNDDMGNIDLNDITQSEKSNKTTQPDRLEFYPPIDDKNFMELDNKSEVKKKVEKFCKKLDQNQINKQQLDAYKKNFLDQENPESNRGSGIKKKTYSETKVLSTFDNLYCKFVGQDSDNNKSKLGFDVNDVQLDEEDKDNSVQKLFGQRLDKKSLNFDMDIDRQKFVNFCSLEKDITNFNSPPRLPKCGNSRMQLFDKTYANREDIQPFENRLEARAFGRQGCERSRNNTPINTDTSRNENSGFFSMLIGYLGCGKDKNLS